MFPKIPPLFSILFLLSTHQIKSAFIYMSTTGSDETGDGSFSNPYLSLMKCQETANEGDTVFIMGGTYTDFNIAYTDSTYNRIHYFTKSFITYKAFNSEKVTFDFEYNQKYKLKDGTPTQRVTGFYIHKDAKNITFEDFTCTRIPSLTLEELIVMKASKNLTQSECINSYGQNITFNRIISHSNYGIGFYFSGTTSYLPKETETVSGTTERGRSSSNAEPGIILMTIMTA